MHWQQAVRLLLAAILAITILLPPTTLEVSAETGDRTLYLYHTHTGETARITFKHNGVYDAKGLAQLNYFLRDFRDNQVTTMSPQLFDLVWEVYQKVGATQPINIVSAYRTPATNAWLHSRSSAVAVHSQHMLGHAMDFFIPGISLVKLRQTGMQQQVGGVGFYPTSGSPFVHMDVGTVRAWPRMTTAQLQEIFPDGKTLHVPENGSLLSNAGRQYAQAQWDQCHAVPCTNLAALGGHPSDNIMLASTTSRNVGSATPTLAASLADSEGDTGDAASGGTSPAQHSVTTIAINAPLPHSRPRDLGSAALQTASLDAPIPFATHGSAPLDDPSSLGGIGGIAPFPAQKSAALMQATQQSGGAATNRAVLAIASLEAPIPAGRVLMTPRDSSLDMVNAYAPPTSAPDPEAQRALQMIIDRETTAALGSGGNQRRIGGGETVALGLATSTLANLVDRTWTAVASVGTNGPAAAGLSHYRPLRSFSTRQTELVAPSLADVLVQPVAMSSSKFATFVEPEKADLNPDTELGPMVNRLNFRRDASVTLTSRFVTTAPLIVATR